MSLTLYGSPNSQPSRSVQAFLLLTSLPFEFKMVSIIRRENCTSEFLKINPRHAIPVLQEDDFVLDESQAIIFYLMDSRGVGKEYYPEDPKIRALVNQYLPYHHRQVRPKLVELFRLAYAPQVIKGRKDNIRHDAVELLRQFEEVFLGNGKYIAGDVFTIADIFAVNELTQVYFNVDMEWSQVLKNYIGRCLEVKALDEVNKEIRKFREVMKGLKGNIESDGIE